MQKYVNDIATVVGGALTPLSNATCTVYVSGTLTLAALYSDNGTTVLNNPTTSSATGQLAFYAADGRYDIVVSKTGYATTTISDVLLEDPAQGQDLYYLPAGTGATSRTVQGKLRETVSPTDFGAVGDGVANDRAAVLLALQSGKIVDGGGLTYAISGTMQPTSFVGLRNANFIQLAPTTASVATLWIYNLSNWFIDNCLFNMGSTQNTGASDDSSKSALRVTNADGSYNQNFRITNVTVTGNGNGSRIQVRQSKQFVIENCLVRDCVAAFTPDPTNDIINGFDISDCANFTVANCNVYDLRCVLASVQQIRYTRGFLFTEVRDCTITGCNSTNADQCYDFSGSVISGTTPAYYEGNRRFTINGCTANNAGTWGFKFANVTHDGLVTGCIANNSGSAGFVFSAPPIATVTATYCTGNIDVVGCKVVNVLNNGAAGVGVSQGFRVMRAAVGTGFDTYPRGIRFRSCEVIDNQTVPTTIDGFVSDVNPIFPTTSGYNTNIASTAVSCSVGPGVTTPFNRLGPSVCVINNTGGTLQTLTSGVYTSITFNNNSLDNTWMHSQTVNTDRIYPKEPGTYQLQANILFTANATGGRLIRLTKNGNPVDTAFAVSPVNSASFNQSVQTSVITTAVPGDYFSVEAYQNSGGNLDVISSQSTFIVQKVD